jgi:hypothetical protein
VTHPASEEGGLNRRFKNLFEKYDRDADALREMLGSEVRDTGRSLMRCPEGRTRRCLS